MCGAVKKLKISQLMLAMTKSGCKQRDSEAIVGDAFGDLTSNFICVKEYDLGPHGADQVRKTVLSNIALTPNSANGKSRKYQSQVWEAELGRKVMQSEVIAKEVLSAKSSATVTDSSITQKPKQSNNRNHAGFAPAPQSRARLHQSRVVAGKSAAPFVS